MPRINQQRRFPSELPAQHRAIPTAAVVNAETRTVTLTFSAGAAVRRARWVGWDTRIEFDEILVVSREAVNMERLESGAPVLDSHSMYSTDAQVGVVERAWIEGRGKNAEARAEVRFPSEGTDERADRIFAMVAQGIIRNVSVGYILNQVRVIEANEKKGTVEQRLVEKWTPYEISFVTVGADAKAQVRSPDESDTYRVAFVSTGREPSSLQGNDIMPNRNRRAAGGNLPADDQNQRGNEPENEDDDAQGGGEGEAGEGRRSQEPSRERRAEPRRQEPAPVIDNAAVQRAAEAALAGERTRVAEINEATRAFGMTPADAQPHIDSGATIHAVRAAFQTVMAERSRQAAPRTTGTVAGVRGGIDERETRVRLFDNALANRLNSSVALEEGSRQFRHLSIIELAGEMLRDEGVSTRGLTKMEIATLATQPGGSMLAERAGLHSTSDFPVVLGNQVNRTLRAAYDAAETTYRRIARPASASDFRPIIRADIGNAPALKKVNEHGEFTYGSVGENAESYRLETFGRILGITRQAMINDDLGAFQRIPQTWGNAAANLENEIVWGLITGNVALADGKALFHADHGNLAANSEAITAESIAEARQAMRNQRGIAAPAGSASDGEIQRISPPNGRILAVPGALELQVLRFLSPLVVPGSEDAVNPYKSLVEPLIEPLLDEASALSWYLFSDPATGMAAIEYAYLDGQEGVYTEQRMGFEIDGIEYKVRLDFGAGAMEHRGTYKNPGEAPSATV